MEHNQPFVKLVEEARTRVHEIGFAEVKTRLDAGGNFLLIDVREESEWNSGHIPSAIHLGRGILERDIFQLEPDTGREIVLYCGGGFRSVLAADNLQKMGYTNTCSMAGGFRGWRESGYPVKPGNNI